VIVGLGQRPFVRRRQLADIGTLASNGKWTLTEPEGDQRVWTDDYSNIIGAVWRRLYPAQ
jgi:hypothetical protein